MEQTTITLLNGRSYKLVDVRIKQQGGHVMLLAKYADAERFVQEIQTCQPVTR